MDYKSNRADFSLLNMFEYLSNYHAVILLLFGIFLFDSLEIIFYGKGIMATDFSCLLKFSAIPFFLFFLASFGVITTSLSVIACFFIPKFINFLLYKFQLFADKFFMLKPRTKTGEKYKDVNLLYETALKTGNVFLLNYIEKELKTYGNVKRSHRVVYSLLISLVFNGALTFCHKKMTLLNSIICFYKNEGLSFITVFLSLLLISVILTILSGLIHSVAFDDAKIYFPGA